MNFQKILMIKKKSLIWKQTLIKQNKYRIIKNLKMIKTSKIIKEYIL